MTHPSDNTHPSSAVVSVVVHLAASLWANARRALMAMHLAPLLAALAIAFAFAEVGQFHELYVHYAEGIYRASTSRGTAAVGLQVFVAVFAMLLLSMTIYAANYALGRFHTSDVFSDDEFGIADPSLECSIRAIGVFASVLPWSGMITGVAFAIGATIERIDALLPAADVSGSGSFFGAASNLIDRAQLMAFRNWLGWVEAYLSFVPSFWWFIGCWLLAVLLWRVRKEAVAIVLGLSVPAAWFRASRQRTRSPGPGHRARGSSAAFGRWSWRSWVWRAMSQVSSLALIATGVFVVGSLAIPAVMSALGGDFGDKATHQDSLVHESARVLTSAVVSIGQRLGIGYEPIENWLLGLGVLAAALGATWVVWHSLRQRRIQRLAWLNGARLVLAIAGLAWIALVVAGLMTFTWIDVSRLLGPLAVSTLLFLTVFGLIAALAACGRQIGIPALFAIVGVAIMIVLVKLEWVWLTVIATAVLIAMMVFHVYWRRWLTAMVASGLAVVLVYGIAARHFANTERQPVSNESVGKLDQRFAQWIAARRQMIDAYPKANGGRRYPVFVVAAEGGGIYAAATAATFLARMQDACPSFAQHVFAVSAVSGGAVGSMVLHHALSAKQPTFAPEGCAGADAQRSLQRTVQMVIQADHLSPLAGLLVADVLGTYDDRAKGLEWSLHQAIADNVPGFARDRSPLPYSAHWNPKAPAPAQVFNTTWARVGNRMVFAPFDMESTEFATLNTFQELGRRRGFAEANGKARLRFVEAAVISARFPGVVAAYEVRHTKEDRRWHFVDGGYVDASGALTAHDIYRHIEKILAAGKAPPIDLKLVLLTSTQKSDEENGTRGAGSRDVVAPVLAILNVRSLLSRNAVRETITKLSALGGGGDAVKQFSQLQHPSQLPGEHGDWKVAVVELNQDEFKLQLGWKISELTFEIVSAQLGQADLCTVAKRAALVPRTAGDTPGEIVNEQRAQGNPVRASVQDERISGVRARNVAKTIRANSCVQHNILRLLGAK